MNDAPLKKLNELSGVAFDGRGRCYVPPSRLNISAKLKLHKKARKDLDPVAFEVSSGSRSPPVPSAGPQRKAAIRSSSAANVSAASASPAARGNSTTVAREALGSIGATFKIDDK